MSKEIKGFSKKIFLSILPDTKSIIWAAGAQSSEWNYEIVATKDGSVFAQGRISGNPTEGQNGTISGFIKTSGISSDGYTLTLSKNTSDNATFLVSSQDVYAPCTISTNSNKAIMRQYTIIAEDGIDNDYNDLWFNFSSFPTSRGSL